MHLYDYVFGNFGYDISCFDKYIVAGSCNKGYALTKFDEADASDYLEMYYKAYNNPCKLAFEELTYRFSALGDDGFRYEWSNGKFVNTGKRYVAKFLRCYLFLKSRNNKMKRNKRFLNRVSYKYSKSAVGRKPSFFSYEAYEFFCKEHEIAFKYRLKKASDAEKPLVIYMSGAGSLGFDNFKQMYECRKVLGRRLKNYDCSVLVPQAPWGINNNISLNYSYCDAVVKLIDMVCVEVKADRKRVYLLGASLGGLCTWEMVYRYPDIFACGMPVMGNILFGKDRKDMVFDRFLKTPMWVAHSSDDNVVKIDSDDFCVEELKKIGADVRYTRWDKYGHKMCNKFYKREPWSEWMFKQVKK